MSWSSSPRRPARTCSRGTPPALAIPFHGVIGSYTSRYAHAENLLQALFPFQTINVVYGSGKGELYPINEQHPFPPTRYDRS